MLDRDLANFTGKNAAGSYLKARLKLRSRAPQPQYCAILGKLISTPRQGTCSSLDPTPYLRRHNAVCVRACANVNVEDSHQISGHNYDISLGKLKVRQSNDMSSGLVRFEASASDTEGPEGTHYPNMDYHLEFCEDMFDYQGTEFLSFRPKDFMPWEAHTWIGSYGKLREGNGRVSFSESELQELTDHEQELDEAYWSDGEDGSPSG